ncbi:hypothetical protein [Streptomyces sp. NPDC051567]|uniref:hypothetical protein n=1 Tax=Streptomyces sp. NPDC051567 TaxID=3365660 RepID=UPI00378991AC
MRRLLTPVITALLLAGAAVPAAEADDLESPYTQAAAVVGPDGVPTERKMIVNSWRVTAGQYCIEIDPLVDVAEATVLVNSLQNGSATSRKNPGTCNRPNSVGVYVFAADGAYADHGYTIAVL